MEMKYKGRKTLSVAVAIYLIGVVAVTGCWLAFLQHENLSAFDKRLLIAAEALPGLLPKDFHDRALDKNSIGPDEDQQNLDNLSTHARIGGFAYLYTYVMDKGQIYFTASNYTDEDVAQNKVSHYWTDYPEGDKAYFDAAHATGPVFVTASDRWGTFRTILISRQSPGGRPYVVGVDIDISEIRKTLWQQIPWVVGAAFLLLLFAVPIAFAMRQALEQKVKTLSGLLPICASCKKIRDDKGYWNRIETYIEHYTEAEFSHGMCPECSEKFYGDKNWYLKMKKDKG